MKDYKRVTKRTKYGIEVLDSGERFVLSCAGYAITKALNRLAELEDKIENSTLIELPCRVGSMVYYIDTYDMEVIEWYFGLDMLRYIGKTVFLTKAEAEKKLEELKNAVNVVIRSDK